MFGAHEQKQLLVTGGFADIIQVEIKKLGNNPHNGNQSNQMKKSISVK
jgi:hypothetical protein